MNETANSFGGKKLIRNRAARTRFKKKPKMEKNLFTLYKNETINLKQKKHEI